MSYFRTMISLNIGLMILGICSVAGAAIRGPATVSPAVLIVSGPSEVFDTGSLLSAELIENYKRGKGMPSVDFNPNVMLPKNLTSGEDPTSVFSKMADTSLQYWWNNSGAKNSVMGRGIDRAEKTLSKEVIVTTKARTHKLNFTVQAFQSTARVAYEGYGNAEVYYQMRDSVFGIKFIEPLGTEKARSLILDQTITPIEQLSEIKLSWCW